MQEGDADVVSAKWNEQNGTNVSMNLDMVRSNHCKMLVPCVCAKYWGTSMSFVACEVDELMGTGNK